MLLKRLKSTFLDRQKMDIILGVLTTILLSPLLHIAEGVYSPTQETAIRTQIFTTNNYDYVSRPAAQTNIKVNMVLLAIDELDLKEQSLTGAGWFTFEWDDTRLTWTPSLFSDIEEIFQEQSKIWKPELVIDNSIDEVGVITDSNLYLRINYQGKIEWEPPQLYEVHCEADITYYPYDRQKCSIDVMSWGYNVEEVTLEAASTGINLEDFETNGEWMVTKSVVELKNVTETSNSGVVKIHPQLKFHLYLQRRSSFYNLNVMIPTICTSLLVVLVFVVPEESGEKLSYVLTVFLSIAVILTLVADSMPPTSITVSILGLYLAVVLILSALAVLFTVGIMILAKRDGFVREPCCLLSVTHFAAKVMCHPFAKTRTTTTVSKVSPSSDDVGDDVSERSIPELELQWREMSKILDKFCFIIFSVVSLITNFAFVLALTVGGDFNEPD